ncbi:MAG: hypothetical protein P4N59_11605 [Negativicutes bacterium]|nr:hypothetical protein [Negativicutes bacterium]
MSIFMAFDVASGAPIALHSNPSWLAVVHYQGLFRGETEVLQFASDDRAEFIMANGIRLYQARAIAVQH